MWYIHSDCLEVEVGYELKRPLVFLIEPNQGERVQGRHPFPRLPTCSTRSCQRGSQDRVRL